MADEVIASKDVVVHDDTLNIDRKVVAGQPVPPDLVDAYESEVGSKKSSKSDKDPDGK